MYTAAPAANTLAGEVLLYVVCPLIVASCVGLSALAVHFVRRIGGMARKLDRVVGEVLPDHGPSLRELVQGQAVELATMRGRAEARDRQPRRSGGSAGS